MAAPSPVPSAADPEGLDPLVSALRSAAAACVDPPEPVTVLYSGGLDSSLVAFLLKPVTRVGLLVIGTDGAKDPSDARRGAELLGLPLAVRKISLDDLQAVERRFAPDLAGLREPLRSVNFALALALEAAPEPRVVVGQGADELFYGYAHFRELAPTDAEARARRDWELLVDQEWPRALRLAARAGHALGSPYLDPEVVRVARRRPPPSLSEPPKHFLREAARALGVPEPLVRAPKRALQYGSGVHRLVRQAGPPP
ncbi:MAG: asparagine synthase-related protein [Thermoplasmata archaeon]|nr:asparagine synthase-related protein [Thermoplasmata archaeon]